VANKLRKAKSRLGKLAARLRKGENPELNPTGALYTPHGKKAARLGIQTFRKNQKFFDYLKDKQGE